MVGNTLEKEKEKIKMPFGKVVSHNLFMLKLIFSASPLYGTMVILNAIRWRGLNFVENTWAIYFVLESVEFGREFSEVLNFLLIILGILVFSGLFSSVFYQVITPVCRARIEEKFRKMLYEKAKELDLSRYDDPYYYNEFVLAVTESANSIERASQFLDKLFQGLTLLIVYSVFFLVQEPLALAFVAASFLGRFFLSNVYNKIQFKLKLAENPLVRKRSYVHRVFYLNDYAKELRLNKEMSRGLYADFDEINDGITSVRRKEAKKKWLVAFLNDYIFRDFITNGVFLTYLTFQAVVKKAMSFSALVVMYNSAYSLRQGMSQLSELFPYAAETALYVEKIRIFLDCETKIISGTRKAPDKPAVIKFEDVSFAYGENAGYTLRNINLTINPLEKIALVGYNGAGKTTLVKLLMRLYDPSGGRITLDGADIRDYRLDEYRGRIGTIFQDYRIYAATVEENVIMDISDQADVEKVGAALGLSGFGEKLGELPGGTQMQLTREFDENGVNLSGGESQKLATARVFYKDASLIILDEPSSALDPIAEYRLNQTMMQAGADKTVVFISHRLSTTRNADRILMLEDGSIIEAGTHDELLGLNGKYAEMWNVQSMRYLD